MPRIRIIEPVEDAEGHGFRKFHLDEEADTDGHRIKFIRMDEADDAEGHGFKKFHLDDEADAEGHLRKFHLDGADGAFTDAEGHAYAVEGIDAGDPLDGDSWAVRRLLLADSAGSLFSAEVDDADTEGHRIKLIRMDEADDTEGQAFRH